MSAAKSNALAMIRAAHRGDVTACQALVVSMRDEPLMETCSYLASLATGLMEDQYGEDVERALDYFAAHEHAEEIG